jgi:hypothetical protein
MEGYKDATEAKKKELDSINELRLEYGSAIPNSVTDLKTAIDFATPLIDKKNALDRQEAQARISKMQQEVVEANDIDSWAYDVAQDPAYISKVPANLKNAVKVRADELKKQMETEMDTELKDNMKFSVEQKTQDFDGLRIIVINGGSLGNIDLSSLSTEERRSYLDYLDQLEEEQKAQKKAGSKGISSFFMPQKVEPSQFGGEQYKDVSIDARIAQLKSANPKISRDQLEVQLTKDGYQFDQIRNKLPFWNSPFSKLFKK